MRPLTRQPWPSDDQGQPIEYSNYRSFFAKLISNFGNVCSYCEGVSKLDVEHVIAKSKDPALEINWTNLLLGCSSCNRDYKKNNNDTRDGYLWPDEIDTFACYRYYPSGDVTVADTLEAELAHKAAATLALCGLNPIPKENIQEPNDYLWQQRLQIWLIAELELEKYSHGTSTVGSIASLAAATGHWSVWITVFKAHVEIIQSISQKYNGTLAKYK